LDTFDDARRKIMAERPKAPAPKPRQGIQSIEIGSRLLRTLASTGQALMLKDLAKGAGMAPAKAHRYLVSFIRAGLVEQNPYTGRYDLGSFALELGLSSLARLDPVRLSAPILDDLCEQINETVALAVWGTHGPTIVRVVEPSSTITITLRTGAVLSLTRAATGRVFAAFGQTPAIRKALDAEIKATADERGVSVASVRAELDPTLSEIRAHGIARASGSLTPGINGFSAPVYDFTGNMIGAVTTLGSVGHFDDAWISPIAIAVREAAVTLSQRLGEAQTARREADL
jgi:DNA-binding IclR family transcriptional regulator